MSQEPYNTFRDALYDQRWLTEKHYHHSYYDDNGVLTYMCARCHRDILDDLHFRYVNPTTKASEVLRDPSGSPKAGVQ